jgi:TonB family protein
MCCKNLWIHLGVFGITIFVGIFSSNAFVRRLDSSNSSVKPKEFYITSTDNLNKGSGTSGGDFGKHNDKNCYIFKNGICPQVSNPANNEKNPKPASTQKTNISSFKITAQPRAVYTSSATEKNIQGVVRLKVVFLATGHIGGISIVSGLPEGLTEKAIEAAKNIKFNPAEWTVTKTVEYRFTIY